MVVAVASPSSAAPAPSAGRLHPTYKEMIMQALTELRDPGGSSRTAIANYIADHFSGLHSRHDALLSVHLRSLRSHGQLRLVSGNYFVSTATQQPAPGQKRGRGRPRKNALDPVASSPSPLQGASALPPPSGVKRGRGRPRKDALVPPPSSSSPLPGAIDPPPPSGVKRGRGRPRKSTLVPVRSSFSQLLGSIAPSLPSGVKRGRGRPRKNAYPAVAPLVGVEQGPAGGQPQRNTTPLSPPPATVPHSGKSKPVRPFRVAVDVSALRGSSMNISACSNSVVGGKEKMQPESVQSADASLKRGRGRPRKEKAVESSHLTEGQQEALTAQAADQAGAVQNEVEARILQSFGTPLMEKRGRGRPRKRPLETETAETQGDALVKKRGRGRPRKARPFETGSVETAVQVSRDLTEDGPEKDGDLVSGKKAEAPGVLLVEGIGNGPADAGCLVVSREKVPIAPMDAGGVLLSAEGAAIAPMDAGRATPRVGPMDVGTKSH